MGSLLGDLPSYNPHNFSQWRPSDSSHRSQLIPLTYTATHDRTMPPADQVISTEASNILIRQFYQKAEHRCRKKRQASDVLSEDSKRARSTSTTYAEDTTDPCFNARQRSF